MHPDPTIDVTLRERYPGLIGEVTLRERWMLDFMNQVTDEINWTKRVNDQGVIEKWREEVTGRAWDHNWTHAGNYRAVVLGNNRSDEQAETQGDFTDEMFQFCIQELLEKAKTYEEFSVIPIFDTHSCILKSDKAFPDKLNRRLKEAVTCLEDIPKKQQDWCPVSGERLLNLVDPSLFPLASGYTWYFNPNNLCLDECLQVAERGEGPFSNLADYNQWLPCDVTFPNGENAKITTYINNLHPRDHANLYLILEEILDIVFPFWNSIAESGTLYGPVEIFQRIPLKFTDFNKRPVLDTKMEDNTHSCIGREASQVPRSIKHENESRNEHNSSTNEGQRDLYQEFPGKYSPRFNKAAYRNKFAFLRRTKERIQVVFKLVNIVLTPEKPEYAEEQRWQTDGLDHEHIVSTAIYYYDDSNIDDSYLTIQKSFITLYGQFYSEAPLGVNLDGLKKVFGIEPNDAFITELGRVKTRSDRFIVFPAGVKFSYRSSSCRLRDPSKPGHRKILVMMLIDPEKPIYSTANVLPQRRDWWLREINSQNTRLANLPQELQDMIVDRMGDFPIKVKEACYIREEMEQERRAVTNRRIGKLPPSLKRI